MSRRLLPLLLLLAACQPSPEQTLALAQLRATGGGDASGGTSVAAMLARARAAAAGPPGQLVLRYGATEVLPDAAQRSELSRFATANHGAPAVVVLARAAGAAGEDASLLSQRRALAVARLLQADFREVQLRFEKEAPVGQVLVLREAGTPLAPGAAVPTPSRQP